MSFKTMDRGEVKGKRILFRPRQPAERRLKDYAINVFFKTLDTTTGDEHNVDVVRVDYKEEHNGIHIDRFYRRTPQRDEYIDWGFWEAWEKLWDNALDWAEKYIKHHGKEPVKIESVRER